MKKQSRAIEGLSAILQSIKRFFTRDFALKSLSLALALVIYAVLSPDTDTSALQLITQPQPPNQAKSEPRHEPQQRRQEPPPAAAAARRRSTPPAPAAGTPRTSPPRAM